ncbi:hypothetical protein FisN_12Hh235 [Fistulifera solaris]|uniref:Uncharacterized protein n=1 Tax=Fistulifera solaris TaxID=1519565 RepID=A0A1Z5KC38_FISSO|nr:hypothetical protein FisN_12Hh235 [Fistulifera solaris]|eukprot:GAX23661.1 hypothetical protein FisN_12Hh235 [Fistulifera solaris]
MSSWERSRYIPWDRIPKGNDIDLDSAKERVFRELQRDNMEEELLTQDTSASMGEMTPKITYSNMQLLRQVAFGLSIGGITGVVFGFMDSMRQVGESSVLSNASNSAKAKYLFQGTTRSSLLFGGFFGGFQALKYGIRVAANPGERLCLIVGCLL